MIKRIEREERNHVTDYTAQMEMGDERVSAILKAIIPDEEKHANRLAAMAAPASGAKTKLESMLSGEKWHQAHTGGWLGDAIYGANDGLGAVFGTVSAVAGATTGNSHPVLLAGIACMLASSLSMGGGAYLATKAEAEVHEAELARERHEIEMDPEHEREELELMYQLKGFTEEEAKILTNRLTQDPEQFLATMAAEELGLSMQRMPNPYVAAFSGTVSTAIGAFLPLIPFFFLTGFPAVVWSGIVSLAAHFGIGAAKTIVTGRSWFASGMEMTVVGIIMAVVTYAIGLALGGHIG
jgi:VIT1/CCC1 family predicted Fe2+/Mn2+ transporter